MSTNDTERVGDRARRGMSWNLVGAVSTNLLRFAVVAILGRALTARDFGIVAAAISINVLLFSIRDLGVGQALVQRKTVERAHLTTAFAISTYIGTALAAMLFVAAPSIARLLQIEDDYSVLQVVGLLFVFRGVATTSRMMCQRAMNFRLIALIDATSFALGSITSVLLALAGAGPWSLVIGYLVEEGSGTAMYLFWSPPPFSLRIDRARLGELLQFGTAQTLGLIAGMLGNYSDNFVIGYSLGPRLLGYYTRAYELVRFPSAVFDNIVGNVLFPAFARMQDDGARLSVTFRRAMFSNAVVLLPASAALFVVAPETIYLLLGGGWDDAVLPFRILVLSMMMRTSMKVGQTLASATGGIRAVAIVYTLYLVLVLGGAAISIRWGISGVAATTALAIAITFMAFSYLGMRFSKLPLSEFLMAHLGGLCLAAVAGLASWTVVFVMRNAQLAPALVFVTAAVASVLATLVTGVFLLSRGWGDFGWLRSELNRVRDRISKRRAPAP